MRSDRLAVWSAPHHRNQQPAVGPARLERTQQPARCSSEAPAHRTGHKGGSSRRRLRTDVHDSLRTATERHSLRNAELAIGEVVGACSSCCSNTAGFSASAASTALSSAAPAASTLARRCALHPTPPSALAFFLLLMNIENWRTVKAKAHVCLSARPMRVAQCAIPNEVTTGR